MVSLAMKLNYSMPPKRPNSFPSSSEWGWSITDSLKTRVQGLSRNEQPSVRWPILKHRKALQIQKLA
ncbi:unnamed protein product, partial [Sphagnum troendelagicum]